MNAIQLSLPLNRPDPAPWRDLAAAHGITSGVGLGAVVWAVLLYAWLV
jgi:hypothetical protein